jgi:predicted amidophosphoribosyltransferase
MRLNGPWLFRTFLYPVLVLVVPAPCSGCGDTLGPRQLLGYCPGCWDSIQPDRYNPHHPYQCAATRYAGLARTVLLEAKFRDRPELFRPMGLRMAAACRTAGLDRGFELVAAVPSHPLTLFRRGYNPARELARVVAGDLGLPLAGHALRRKVLHMAPLKKASREDRRLAARSAFTAHHGAFQGKRVLLVDDILTTGSTFRGCRSALLDAGASAVRLLVWGRTPAASSGGQWPERHL